MKYNKLAGHLIVVFASLVMSTALSQDLFSKERLGSQIASRIGPDKIPSITVAVVHHGAIVWEEGFGWADEQRRIKATPTTPYYLASVTKALTGIALSLLAQQGAIDMDSSVNRYLGSHRVKPELWDEGQITVQRVADQIAGLTSFDLDCGRAPACELNSVIDRYGVIVRSPGEIFDYSNLGYGILGGIIANASKRSYAEFVKRSVFGPLGMADCQLPVNGQAHKGALRYDAGTKRAVPPNYPATPAASAMFCSAHSLALLGRAMLTRGSGKPSRPIDSPWTESLLSGGSAAGLGLTYKLGWWIQRDYVGRTLIYASGGTRDSSAILRVFPSDDFAIAVLANTGTGAFDGIVDAIADEFLPDVRERRKTWVAPVAPSRQRSAVSREVMGTWTGAIHTYRGDKPLELTIDADGNLRGAMVAPGADVPIQRAFASGSRVFGALAGSLDVDELRGEVYDLQLSLALNSEHLAGSATTNPRNGGSVPLLSFFVDLARLKP